MDSNFLASSDLCSSNSFNTKSDRVDVFVEVPRLWFFAAVTCIMCLRGYFEGGRGGGSLG